jgi:glycosyltransferase involved in cell wall biosynthesis
VSAPDADPAPETGHGLSVVVPVYNEQDHVAELLRRVRQALPDAVIIVINDKSTDGTAAILETLAGESALNLQLHHHEVNQGKGAAVRTGFALVATEFLVVQDADLEYDPAELPKLMGPLRAGTAEACYGSRFLARGAEPLSGFHVFGNKVLTMLGNMATGLRMTDMETCYKMVRTEIVQKLGLRENGFGFDPELTIGIVREGGRIVELPVSYKARSWAEGKKIGVRDLFWTLWVIAREGFRLAPWRALRAVLFAFGIGALAGAAIYWLLAG